MYRPIGMLVAIVIATVRTTARISVPIKTTPSAEPLGADHRDEQIEAHENADDQECDVHSYTFSQNRMKRTSAAKTVRPSRIIPSKSIADLSS
jgi:hypothetical protein